MLFPWISLMISILSSGKLDGFAAPFAMVDFLVNAVLTRSLGSRIYSTIVRVTGALWLQAVPLRSLKVDET